MADKNKEEISVQAGAPGDAGMDDGEEEGGGAPLWMCTFADMVTLLMCFFVLLFAMSSTQQETFKELMKSLKSALGIEEVPEAGMSEARIEVSKENRGRDQQAEKQEIADRVSKAVQQELDEMVSDVKELIMFNKLGGLVRVREGRHGVIITISDMVLFSLGEARMTKSGLETMEKVSHILKQFSYPVSIAGHTDPSPIHTNRFPSNWELSVCRATEVVRFLIRKGMNPKLITAEGYAAYRPLADNSTPEGRARNRRVEIVYNRDHIVKTMSGQAF
jgi:chemotaxis protein MotB